MQQQKKNTQQTISDQIQQYFKGIISDDEVGFISAMQGWFNIHTLINVIYHMIRMKDKNSMIISINAKEII